MDRIAGFRSSNTAPPEAYLAPLLDKLLAAGNSLVGSELASGLPARWQGTYRARRAQLARPIHFDLVAAEFIIPEYVCADRDHDCIVHLEAREYILGSGYAPWEDQGAHCGDRTVIAAYPPAEGPEYAHLEPVARKLIGAEPNRWRRVVDALRGRRKVGWSMGHEGYSLRLDHPIDFPLLEREFIFPPNIELSPKQDQLADKYTWVSIYGSRTPWL